MPMSNAKWCKKIHKYIYIYIQFSNSNCKHRGMETPLSSSFYHIAVPFHYPQITITLQNLTCYYSPGIGFILPCPRLCSSFLPLGLHALLFSFYLSFLSFALFSIASPKSFMAFSNFSSGRCVWRGQCFP